MMMLWVALRDERVSSSSKVPWTTVVLPRLWRAVSSSVERRKAVMGMSGYFSRNTLRNAPVSSGQFGLFCEYLGRLGECLPPTCPEAPKNNTDAISIDFDWTDLFG